MSGTASAPEAGTTELRPEPWRDPACPTPDRVADLLARMTLEEKVGQLYSGWIGSSSSTEDMAPHQHDLADETLDWPTLIASGLGQLTRPFGTAPVDPALGVRALARMQDDIVAASRFGIPAIVHEECLTGFMAWRSTVFPTPLAWGATFDPPLVERMAGHVGSAMRAVGVHQGLAPVLDVTRDARWGRTEETIGEDPYLVATIGTAYVRGLEQAGIVATLKHFVGYSGSRGGRNFGPVSVGRRELADVFLIPFEMAVRDGRARSVMHSYAEIDGIPTASDGDLLTTLLRDTWGFTGTVVADYFGVSFLEILHRVVDSTAQAAVLALTAGVDIELPARRCYGALVAAVRTGLVSEALVDRAAGRVLRQKVELGLLDPDWRSGPDGVEGELDLDPPAGRALAREVAEESVVLLANNGVLPLAPEARVALVGPLADDVAAMLGCYTFPSHVGVQHPGLPVGVELPTVRQALGAECSVVAYEEGCGIDDPSPAGIEAAVAAAAGADVCVAVLGDRAGLFGLGTSGEGCDADDLELPGVQGRLLTALLETGTPVVLVLMTGRPYALGAYVDGLAAIVQAFFPGEEGAGAVAGVLSGRVAPSGRLPVSVPRHPGPQSSPYLAPVLGQATEVSTSDPTALYPFGHGLSYTAFDWCDPAVEGRSYLAEDEPAQWSTDGRLSVSVTVRNLGVRDDADVVQLYLHDPVAQVTRPVLRLIGYARVPVPAGESRRVTFDLSADLCSFTGRDGFRVVEPGDVELRLAASSVSVLHTIRARLVGPERIVDHRRHLVAEVSLVP